MSVFDDIVRDLNTEDDVENLSLTAADESAIFIAAMMESAGIEETLDFVHENASELQAYGLIDDAEVAVEATRNIVRLNKQANFSKVKGLTAIRLARQANDNLYKKYKFHRDKFLAYRDQIMTKYDAKATAEARKSIQNAKRNASRMSSKHGSDITKRMDQQMKKFDDKKSTAIAK